MCSNTSKSRTVRAGSIVLAIASGWHARSAGKVGLRESSVCSAAHTETSSEPWLQSVDSNAPVMLNALQEAVQVGVRGPWRAPQDLTRLDLASSMQCEQQAVKWDCLVRSDNNTLTQLLLPALLDTQPGNFIHT